MAIISNVLLVLFIISAILMTLLVIFQDDQGDGIGGLFSSGSSPFRSRSGNLLQHMTTAVAIFFFVTALGYAFAMKPRDPLANLNIAPDEGTYLESINQADSQEPDALNFNFDLNANSSGIGFGDNLTGASSPFGQVTPPTPTTEATTNEASSEQE
ncbi:preprotein translocase subunit SecG [Entomospira culicis]|uniref:Protein-export membrane protein SecG n=1 Tax=Entomospira culicis TaxID=2719989 RepID=A0A968GE86_9SPIO|nr:preprotein translocase subunit SecG [Entomospira culicis]NIZ18713.1 preprotein translocase subunit SecG [Entomospira culicis]NIZ68928.1 preprotein translocase subunit SecG [Entomospira culicis]WDI37521.1 preprotein translocase subunit SecG [Entomospira culicis]WDI39149.1 preprotein translocase subunit SecG [Entomospira culicis]